MAQAKGQRALEILENEAEATGLEQLEISLVGLPECIEDVRQAALDADAGPTDPTEFHQLRGRLQAARSKLPPAYRSGVHDPYVQTLDDLGPVEFNQILVRDPARDREAGLMLDIAHAILQNGERFSERATDAFQEVVSDLYDGFLSAADRVGVEPPDRGILPPLVKWGQPEFGPYTFPVEATASFGCEAAIVSLPPSNARRGLLAWAALPHETAGHDILSADTGLRGQLRRAILAVFEGQNMDFLADYWADRIDETAADVMGILNMGPTAGIGLIGYFRGLNAAFTGVPQLRNSGPAQDSHPADILRGFLAASTVRLLQFDRAKAWADLIEQETNADVQTIRLAGRIFTPEEALRSAELTAKAIAQTRVAALEDHSLADIQNWRNSDEEVTLELCELIATPMPMPTHFDEGVFAAHAVAGAVLAGLEGGTDLDSIFVRTVDILKRMHDGNPSWGPLFVLHPGNVGIHRFYEPMFRSQSVGQVLAVGVGRRRDLSIPDRNGVRRRQRSKATN